MLWVIWYNEKIKYKIYESNHTDWFNKVPLYKTSICSKFHGSLFEYFITHVRTDKYKLMCYIVAHDKTQPDY